jgi:hypothetical protein
LLGKGIGDGAAGGPASTFAFTLKGIATLVGFPSSKLDVLARVGALTVEAGFRREMAEMVAPFDAMTTGLGGRDAGRTGLDAPVEGRVT